MKNLPKLTEVRVEVVTTTFVAAGTPEGIHDLGRFLENLNNPALSRQIEFASPAVRPLYSATAQLELNAPLLVRREDIVFATFEGPHFTRGSVKSASIDVPALLLAPPFQLLGSVSVTPGGDATQALRTLSSGFFSMRKAKVFDADGNALGEGEQIVVNGAAVQMMSATRQRIDVGATSKRALEAVGVEPEGDAAAAEEAIAQKVRAA